MFVADMHCYGRDPECAGVTGIVGCMGLVLSYNGGDLYAIHVPDNDNGVLTKGRDKFVKYVKKQQQGYQGSNAELFTLVNGTNRTDSWSEGMEYARALDVRKLTEVRIDGHIPPTKSQAMGDSIVVLVRRVAGKHQDPYTIYYRKASLAGLVNRTSKDSGSRGGAYHQNIEYKNDQVPKSGDVEFWARAIPNATAKFKTQVLQG